MWSWYIIVSEWSVFFIKILLIGFRIDSNKNSQKNMCFVNPSRQENSEDSESKYSKNNFEELKNTEALKQSSSWKAESFTKKLINNSLNNDEIHSPNLVPNIYLLKGIEHLHYD